MFSRRNRADGSRTCTGSVGGLAPAVRREFGVRRLIERGTFAAWAVIALTAASAEANTIVRLDYNRPLIDQLRRTAFIELFDDRPLSRDNFLQYVDGGHYDGSLVHRLARNFVIQAGGYYPEFLSEPTLSPPISLNPNAQVDLDGDLSTPNPTVMNEYGNSPTRSNVRGTIAMARRGGLPDSADSEWFVNLGNNSGLDQVDGGFTVFAHVIGDGMTLYDTYNNGLAIVNLNPDVNNDGVRDSGPGNPFWIGPNDGVPVLGSYAGVIVLEKAQRVDYLGNGLTTHVPSGGLTFSDRDTFIDTGTIFTGSGALTVAQGRTLGIREGFSLQRDLINRGVVAPGLDLGTATVQNYFQFGGGTLEIQLVGTTADTEYDRIVATQSAFLAGELDIELIGGFNPEPGDAFTIVQGSSLVGNFTSVDLPMLSPGLVWNFDRALTSLTLSVVAADFNKDGMVDAADYIIWRKNRSRTVTPYTLGDANGDGRVNATDLTILQTNYGNIAGTGQGAGAGSAAGFAVPEPSAVLLAMLGAAMLAARRRPIAASRR